MTDQELIRWKSAAWADVQAARSYALQMHAPSNRLANFVETRLVQRFARGQRILDAGIGTGRASLPLARTGHAVTGIDSSEAMLEECRSEAAGVPIDLAVADIRKLPFEADTFDTVVSLNVIVHFPDYAEILSELVRVLRPGGTLLFDVHSADCLDALAGSGLARPVSAGHENYERFLGSAQLIKFAESAGICAQEMIPYQFFEGDAWLRESYVDSYHWKPVLDWAAHDDRLFAFFTFLEEDVIGKLGTIAAPRLFCAFQKRPDAQSNAAFLERIEKKNGLLRAPGAGALFGADAPALVREFARHCSYSKNFAVLGMLFVAPRIAGYLRPVLASILSASRVRELNEWYEKQARNSAVADFLEGWGRDEALAANFEYAGVNVADAFAYELAEYLFGGSAPAL